jgi:hypothetical protein
MNVEFTHARKGVEGSEELIPNVHCGQTGQPWENELLGFTQAPFNGNGRAQSVHSRWHHAVLAILHTALHLQQSVELEALFVPL